MCKNKTVGIGLAGLDNLTCFHDVRVNLTTVGVFEEILLLLLDEVARSNVYVNSLLDAPFKPEQWTCEALPHCMPRSRHCIVSDEQMILRIHDRPHQHIPHP